MQKTVYQIEFKVYQLNSNKARTICRDGIQKIV